MFRTRPVSKWLSFRERYQKLPIYPYVLHHDSLYGGWLGELFTLRRLPKHVQNGSIHRGVLATGIAPPPFYDSVIALLGQKGQTFVAAPAVTLTVVIKTN